MREFIYNPYKSGRSMTIVCFISGSGTNYREIVAKDPDHHYLVFTNRPGCEGLKIAKENKHETIELSHIPFLREARKRYPVGMIPRNCQERLSFEQEAVRLIESKLGGQPDLICMAGYDQWLTDWTVERYFPHMINVHPGDTTRGYSGLHWIPTARAILAGEKELRSTVFIVDTGEDTGPVLVQSNPVDIEQALSVLEVRGTKGLLDRLEKIVSFSRTNNLGSYESFIAAAGKELKDALELVCTNLQEILKVSGDWKIYPFAVHDLVAQGRVEIDGRTIYVEDEKMPPYGYRKDEHRCQPGL